MYHVNTGFSKSQIISQSQTVACSIAAAILHQLWSVSVRFTFCSAQGQRMLYVHAKCFVKVYRELIKLQNGTKGIWKFLLLWFLKFNFFSDQVFNQKAFKWEFENTAIRQLCFYIIHLHKVFLATSQHMVSPACLVREQISRWLAGGSLEALHGTNSALPQVCLQSYFSVILT